MPVHHPVRTALSQDVVPQIGIPVAFERTRETRILRIASILFVSVLTAAAAQISMPLPFTPVPLTFQPVVVLLGGVALGARAGMVSQILYLAAGIMGFAVFAASPVLPQGAARLIGPTGGYLLAFPFAAFVSGMLAQRGFARRYLPSVLTMGLGLTVIFMGGVLWLAFMQPLPMRLTDAMRAGFYPFIVVDIVKLLAGAAAAPALSRFIGPASAAPER